MAKDRHILHAAARRRGNSSRAAVLIAALAVLAGATAAVQPAYAQTDDHGNTIAEATAVELGGMQAGVINPGDDVDYFVVVVAATTTLTIHTTGNLDTIGTLEDSDGSIVENDDIDPDTNRNFRIAPDRQFSPGTYYIRVRSFLTLVGFYTIHINFIGSRTVSIEPRISHILPGTAQTLTLQVSPLPLPATARLTITTGGDEAGHINLPDPATVTIPAGMTAATFDITLAAEATASNTGTVSLSDAVFIHTDDTTDTVVISGELFVLNIDITANVFTLIVGDPSALVNICDRTPEVESAILSSGVTETNCAVVPQAQLNDVTDLRLTGFTGLPSATTTLRSDDFANLPHLELLNLDDNALVSLPANVFDGLISLRRLLLGTNSLESLPAGLFDDLFALWMLILDSNSLNPPLSAGLFNDVLDTLATLTLDDALKTTVSIDEPRTATITPDRFQTLTVRLTPPSPATVRLTIISGGNQARNVTLPDPATVTIPAGMTTATFDITLAAGATGGSTGTVSLSAPVLLYTDTSGVEQENIAVVNSLVNTLNTDSNTFAFTVAAPPPPSASFTRHNDITMVNEPTAGNTLTIRFDYTLSNIPAGRINHIGVNFSPLDPDDMPVNGPPFNADPPNLGNGLVSFNNRTFIRYTYNADFYFPATYNIMIKYTIEPDDNNTNDDFSLGINSIEIREGSTDVPIPVADISIPGGRLVTVNGVDYAVQTIRIKDAQAPVATLTRNRASVPEDGSEDGVFTLALTNTVNGKSTVTYTLAVAGDTPANYDINAALGGDAAGTPVIGSSSSFTINADGRNDIIATLTITPESDADTTNETVTLTINSIEVAGLTLGPDDIQGADVSNGTLSITVIDDGIVPDPAATYDLTEPLAFEPASATATDTTTATFTITLSNLNTAQLGSDTRRFFFRFASSNTGTGNSLTPGYGSLGPGIQGDARADPGDDFDFILEYESLNGSDEMIVFSTGSQGYSNPDSDGQIDRAARDFRGREIYTFLIIPKHDDIDNEGLEHVVFGYRVFFGGLTPDGAHPLTGVVNGGTGDPAAAIQERSDAIRLRIRTFLEGALQ